MLKKESKIEGLRLFYQNNLNMSINRNSIQKRVLLKLEL